MNAVRIPRTRTGKLKPREYAKYKKILKTHTGKQISKILMRNEKPK